MATKKSENKKKKGLTADSLIANAKARARKDYDPGPELTEEVRRIIEYNDNVHPVSDRIKVADVLTLLESNGHKTTSERFQDWVRRTFPDRSSFTQKK